MAKSLNAKGSNSEGMIDGEVARKFLDRLASVDDDIDALVEDRKAIFDEARRAGFLVKVLRQKHREERMDADRLAKLRREQDYMDRLNVALGEFINTPLGSAAVAVLHPHAGPSSA